MCAAVFGHICGEIPEILKSYSPAACRSNAATARLETPSSELHAWSRPEPGPMGRMNGKRQSVAERGLKRDSTDSGKSEGEELPLKADPEVASAAFRHWPAAYFPPAGRCSVK